MFGKLSMIVVLLVDSRVPKQVALRVQVAYNVSSPGQLNPAKTKLTNLADKINCVQSGVCKVTTSVAQPIETTTAQPVVQEPPIETAGGVNIILVVVGTVQGESHLPYKYSTSAGNRLQSRITPVQETFTHTYDAGVCNHVSIGLVFVLFHSILLLD